MCPETCGVGAFVVVVGAGVVVIGLAQEWWCLRWMVTGVVVLVLVCKGVVILVYVLSCLCWYTGVVVLAVTGNWSGRACGG